MFVVPPYLNERSYVPVLLVNPEDALRFRAGLSGARLYDQEAARRRTDPVRDFRDSLPALAGIANIAVSARWTAEAVLWAQDAWRDLSIATDIGSIGSSLSDDPSELRNKFFWQMDEIIKISTCGIKYANLTKVLALASPCMFPMLDQYICRALHGHARELRVDNGPKDFRFYMERFCLLLRFLQGEIQGLSSPNGNKYSNVEKLDRLLWMSHWGAKFYSSKDKIRTWISISNLPEVGLISRDRWSKDYARRYAMARARVVLPVTELGGNVAEPDERFDTRFNDLDGASQGVVVGLLEEAAKRAERLSQA